MRFHQSWWRANVLGVDYGRGPKPTSKRRGNMLDDDGAEQLLNFLDEDCRQAYRNRAGPGVEEFRAKRNLLSSQPMCFNLFGPMVVDPQLRGPLLGALTDRVDEVTDAQIEWQQPKGSDLLGDRTAFDAYFAYTNTRGGLEILAVETKLTEKFSQSKDGNHDRYAEIVATHPEIWRERDIKELRRPRWYQLWRNHLLAQALADQRGVGRARVAVVHHPSDPDCRNAIAGYRKLLGDESLLLDWPIDGVLDAWRPIVADDPARASWLDAFELRYLALEASELAWQEHAAVHDPA